jgi:hypothetical protein
MRKSAYEIDQSRRKLRHCLQWIIKAEQGLKSVGERSKRYQWILTAGKTGKSGKRGKMCDIIVVKG